MGGKIRNKICQGRSGGINIWGRVGKRIIASKRVNIIFNVYKWPHINMLTWQEWVAKHTCTSPFLIVVKSHLPLLSILITVIKIVHPLPWN